MQVFFMLKHMVYIITTVFEMLKAYSVMVLTGFKM